MPAPRVGDGTTVRDDESVDILELLFVKNSGFELRLVVEGLCAMEVVFRTRLRVLLLADIVVLRKGARIDVVFLGVTVSVKVCVISSIVAVVVTSEMPMHEHADRKASLLEQGDATAGSDCPLRSVPSPLSGDSHSSTPSSLVSARPEEDTGSRPVDAVAFRFAEARVEFDVGVTVRVVVTVLSML